MAQFQSFWFGDGVPPYQRLAMKSFVDHGHAYALYAYQNLDVPAGVELRDANEVLPHARVFFYGDRAEVGRGSVSAFSNLFRYHLLRRNGGWWVDADVVCLSAQVPSADIFLGWEYDDLIGSAILKFPGGHEFARALCESAEQAGTNLEWGETGPHMLTRLVRERGLLHLVSPQPSSYPVQSKDAVHLLMPSRRDEIAERIGALPFLHLWNEILRRAVVFTWMAPPPGSYLAELFARHGVGFGDAPAYTAEQIQRLNDNYYTFTHWDWDRKQLLRQHEELQAGNAESARLTDRLRAAQARAETLTQEVAQLRAQVQALQASTSWRVTAPLRRVATMLRSIGRFGRR